MDKQQLQTFNFNFVANFINYILVCSVGNHDHGYNPPNTYREWYQVDHSELEPRWYMPDVTYAFTATSPTTSVKFVIIDTQSLRYNKNDKECKNTFSS